MMIKTLEKKTMTNKQSELRLMWLLGLLIVGVGSWFVFENHVISLLCGLAFVMSIMQYVNVLAQQAEPQAPVRSRVPLYMCSILAVIAAVLQWSWLFGLALSLWIYFLLSWLQRLEQRLNQRVYEPQVQPLEVIADPFPEQNIEVQTENLKETNSLSQSIQHWLFQGNPVLKGAIVVLVIGVILLLRFATEYWQVSLSVKLLSLVGIAALVTAFGVYLSTKNRSFALGLQGLGIATLCLDLFFSYYNQLLPNFWVASLLFAGVMALSIYLSLKQKSLELALMAMLIAYVAPFTLPIRDATAIEFLAYYLAINVAIAVLTTLRPWKVLNQIGFLVTLFVGGGYVLLHGQDTQQDAIALLVVLHSAVFIWLAFRFSQLLSQQDVQGFALKPTLDLGLLFGAPLVAYGALYLIYFEQITIQALLSLGYAILYVVVYLLARQQQQFAWVKHSYLSLALIFTAFIPAIVLPQEWSVVGWVVLGTVVFILALQRQSDISRYVAMALLLIAGCSAAYYLVDLDYFASHVYWVLALCYLAVVIISHYFAPYRQQLRIFDSVFLSGLNFVAVLLLQVLCLDALEGKLQSVITLSILTVVYLIMNELMMYRRATESWTLAKWVGMLPIFAYAFWLLFTHSKDGQMIWYNAVEQGLFIIALLLLAMSCIRPKHAIYEDREWVSLTTLTSLALASVALVTSMPFLSVVILPLGFALWCAKQETTWQQFWQARSSLVLMVVWIITSQLFSQHAFTAYLLPILNPFDAISIAMLLTFIWMLLQQQKSGLERGLLGVCSVLGALWLSSYIVLRALHVYFDTPYNSIAIWQDATVQMSLTLLWVSLAFITMQFASRKKLKGVWLLGASVLVIVSLKLVLLDLANIGTLSRVLSFLGAGLVMLIIAYIAPMPEQQD